MAKTVTIDTGYASANGTTTGRETLTGEALIDVDVGLTSSQSNKHVDAVQFKITDLAAGALLIFSDVALTVKTNDANSPDDTFTVALGGVTRVTELSADITDLYLTNGTASVGNVEFRGVKDATP